MQKKNLTQSHNLENREDNIYYNITLTNNNEFLVPASYSQTLTANIVDNTEDYYLSVARFSLDGSALPIFIFKNNTGAPLPTTYGYWITLSWSTFTFSYNLNYTTTNVQYPNGVYNYSTFIAIINDGFAGAIAGLNAASGGTLPTLVQPYMIYDPTTNLVSLYAPTAYLTSGVSPINIFFNNILFDFFSNINSSLFLGQALPSHQDVQLRIVNIFNTNTSTLDPSIPAGFYKMSQDYPSLYRMFDWSSIVFKSNILGIRSEYIQGSNNTKALAPGSSSGSGVPFDNIMTDFVLDIDSSDPAGWRGNITYTPAFYRLIDILGTNTNKIDLAIFVRDKQNNEYPFYIVSEANAIIKLIFAKKSLYKNYKKS
jgi:hypothetical protein